MTKCDFCTMSDPRGKCFWSSRVAAEDELMTAEEYAEKILKHEPVV